MRGFVERFLRKSSEKNEQQEYSNDEGAQEKYRLEDRLRRTRGSPIARVLDIAQDDLRLGLDPAFL